MGKAPVAAPTPETTRKKKGRPSKHRPPLTNPPQTHASNPTSHRSTRRNPNHLNSLPQPKFDDDDERKQKKVKLVERLPQSDENVKVDGKSRKQQKNSQHSQRNSGSGSGSYSESDQELEDREWCAKKRKIEGVDNGSDDGIPDQDNEVVRETGNSVQVSTLESGPRTPLPEKKFLIFVLERLQKKDTHGVFSEPVDPNELPDYFDIIEQPMDFGTVWKKLDNEAYKNLEELEADVLLICSNAMQYNSADTVYYRQARSIQNLAKRDFDNLRHEGEPKVIRRGRPPNCKNQKKAAEAPPLADHRVGTDLCSGATLAKASGPNSYNLRKGPALIRVRSADPFVSRNIENHSEWSIDWNIEFPASILRADMKHGKKQFTVDENRRDTYHTQSDSLSAGYNSLVLANCSGNVKQLVPVGFQEALAYTRSLARYAANLGPVAWKMASRKIEAAGPGWPSNSISIKPNGVPSREPSCDLSSQVWNNNTLPPQPGCRVGKPTSQLRDNINSINNKPQQPDLALQL